MKKFISILLVAALALSLAACGGTNAGSTVSTDGSTSMEKVIGGLGEMFMEMNSGVTFTYNPTGSSAGITAVAEGHCDIGLASRSLKAEEAESGLTETVLAYDGIAVIVNPANPVSDLDVETNIRSINSAAAGIFGTDEACVGGSFFQINRSHALRQALNDALDKGHGSVMQELEGRIYRFDMSSIQSDGNLLGAVILAVDVTESQNAEQMRREFSANVSHELKTPLQSIIGSAELLESGMVKAEDTPRFVGHIRKEASRLVNLIEDIIRLSQLDEGVQLPTESVNILKLAQEVTVILQPSADEKNVSISISGEGFELLGARRMLQEIIYNLCDNAIKYNVPGGSVTIRAENNRLVVSDTGIGIPAEHKDRIFERFYRVDKSHSKASGGTGLGLSIVKHAASYHKAEIHLDSTPGKGTTITIQF